MRPTQPPGILGGWEPRQGEGVSANKYLPGAGLMFPGCGGTLEGTARQARWSGTSPDPARCFRGQLGGEQGAGPWDSLGLQSPCPPPRTQNHRAPSSWAGAQCHRASVPPRRGGRALALRPQAHPIRPPGASKPTGTHLGPSRTLPASLSPQLTSKVDNTKPQPGLQSSQSWLPSFLHSFIHSFIHSNHSILGQAKS